MVTSHVYGGREYASRYSKIASRYILQRHAYLKKSHTKIGTRYSYFYLKNSVPFCIWINSYFPSNVAVALQ